MVAPGDGSYSGDPTASTLDAVRCLLGDTGGTTGTDWILSDAEIAYVDGLAAPVFGDPIMTAAIAADIIAGRYAGEVSISADGVSISGEMLQDKFLKLAASLRQTYKTLAAVGGLPLVGGIDAFTVRDPSVKPFNFRIGMDDNLRAGSQLADGRDDWYYQQSDSEPW